MRAERKLARGPERLVARAYAAVQLASGLCGEARDLIDPSGGCRGIEVTDAQFRRRALQLRDEMIECLLGHGEVTKF